jgi:hypothetical protein
MSPHISNLELRAYFAKSMSTEALIAFDEHLSQCEGCKELFGSASKLDLDAIDNALIRNVLSGESAPTELDLLRSEHLSYEQLEAYVGRNLLPDLETRLSAHLKNCSTCAGELRDLEGFALQMTQRVPTERWTSKLRKVFSIHFQFAPRRWAAVSLLVVCGFLAVLVSIRKTSTTETVPVEKGLKISPSGEPRQIKDLPILSAKLSAEDFAALSAARSSRSISTPPILKKLSGTSETLLGTSVAEKSLSLIEPVGEVDPQSMPVFKWTPVEGVKSYIAELFTMSFRRVQTSGPISETQWRAKRPLQAGVIYLWQVTALMANGRSLVAPEPPAPEAKFMVMDPKASEKLAKMAEDEGQNHLLLAVLYGQAGAVQTAEKELQNISKDDPDYSLAQELLASLPKNRR